MKLLDKLKEKKEHLQKQYQKGKELTLQDLAEKKRKRLEKAEPGTFRYGLAHKQGVKDFMGDVYERRKLKRSGKK